MHAFTTSRGRENTLFLIVFRLLKPRKFRLDTIIEELGTFFDDAFP